VRSSLVSVGATLALVLFGTAAGGPRARTRPAPSDYARADAATIRTHVQKILSDPRFAPHKTFWQWLQEKLVRWEGPHLPKVVTKVIEWVVIVWCIFTLLAIFAHLTWTIWLLARPQRGSPGSALPAGSEDYENASFEELWERSAELARRGAFRAAVGVLLVALLRQLEALKVLHLHKSKTNGEYVREYPGQRAGRQEFVQFVAAFERSIYGGSEVAGPTYTTLTALAQQVVSNASSKPQV
jgi:Domain of unknown function (DUF4129)